MSATLATDQPLAAPLFRFSSKGKAVMGWFAVADGKPIPTPPPVKGRA